MDLLIKYQMLLREMSNQGRLVIRLSCSRERKIAKIKMEILALATSSMTLLTNSPPSLSRSLRSRKVRKLG
jgi:hypothetical protein